MPNVLDIRRRIRSVRSTQQITKAMKMVSAAKLRRAQERVMNARPFAMRMQSVLNSLVSRCEIKTHPLLEEREEKEIRLVVVTSDKGLCGAFNTNIIKTAQRFVEEHKSQEVTLTCVGRKGRDFFRKHTSLLAQEYINVANHLSFMDARAIANTLMQEFTSGEVDAVYVLYNEFKSVMQQRIVVEKLLPLPRIEVAAGENLIDYIYEQPAEEIYSKLIPLNVEIRVYQALVESVAAEHGARMTAMDAATENAIEMIDSLTLTMNRARQASITKEIIEIVSGAAALG
jgi:F-type H+-transporting ATPase subunit gamma